MDYFGFRLRFTFFVFFFTFLLALRLSFVPDFSPSFFFAVTFLLSFCFDCLFLFFSGVSVLANAAETPSPPRSAPFFLFLLRFGASVPALDDLFLRLAVSAVGPLNFDIHFFFRVRYSSSLQLSRWIALIEWRACMEKMQRRKGWREKERENERPKSRVPLDALLPELVPFQFCKTLTQLFRNSNLQMRNEKNEIRLSKSRWGYSYTHVCVSVKDLDRQIRSFKKFLPSKRTVWVQHRPVYIPKSKINSTRAITNVLHYQHSESPVDIHRKRRVPSL